MRQHGSMAAATRAPKADSGDYAAFTVFDASYAHMKSFIDCKWCLAMLVRVSHRVCCCCVLEDSPGRNCCRVPAPCTAPAAGYHRRRLLRRISAHIVFATALVDGRGAATGSATAAGGVGTALLTSARQHAQAGVRWWGRWHDGDIRASTASCKLCRRW